MFKKTIAFTDYDGVDREEDFYFNLTDAEISELTLSVDGGLEKMIESITKTRNVPKIIEVFKKIILASYGEKSPDGRRFIKVVDGHRLAEDFEQTPAYSILFMELGTNEEAGSEFINNLVIKKKEHQTVPAPNFVK